MPGHAHIDRAEETPQASFGLRVFLAMALRRRWIILSVSLPIILVAIVGTFNTAERVTASTRIMVIGREPETPGFNNRPPDWDLLMSTSAQIVRSIPVAELAATALYDTLRSIHPEDPSFPRFTSKAQLKRALLNGVDSGQIGESNLLNISFTHKNRDFTLIAVTALAHAFIKFSISSQRNESAVSYYTDQINALQHELDGLLNNWSQTLENANLSAIEDNPGNSLGQINALVTAMINVRSQRFSLESKLRSLKRAIAADPHYIPVSSSGESMYIQGILNQLNDLTAEMSNLKSQYQPGSEWIVRKQRAIDELWKNIKQQRDDYLQDLMIRIDELRGKEDSYRRDIDKLRADMKDYPIVQKRIKSLEMQINAQQSLLKALQLKRGEVRMKAEADSRISNLYQLDEPHIDAAVAGSKKMLYLAIAILFAIALGFTIGWFVDIQDHRIIDRLQAEQVLQVPVLGTISSDPGDRSP